MDTFHSFALVLVLSISFTGIFRQPFAYVNADTDLIQRTCKTTKYYDPCLSSLKSDSTSPVANTKGLAVIMDRIGMANATSTNSYLTSQLFPPKTTNSYDALKKRVLKECAEKYSYVGEALKSTLQNLKDELYDYANMNVMAAADYPNVYHNAFKRYPNLVYPKQLALRENSFKHICDVVLRIIDALNW
ncbi:cell wall / vacuolar inhibitor of fructosidase 2-like [Apium graveolens]|uniref:cell wall / vacuolar inhibitor of fructosidase 2-like n=1 Tax=Apium graveolens TaxID=4045 RepID=UPI003D797A1C